PGPSAPSSKPVASLPTQAPLWRRILFRPRTLALLALITAAGLAMPMLRNVGPALAARPEFQLTPADITLPPAPAWIPRDLANQVFKTAGLGEQLSLLDSAASEKVAAAFHTHPWIERVVTVQKRWPPRIVVEAVYREPVAMVRGVDGFYPVDRHAVLLPARDFSAGDVQKFPVIEQVTTTPAGRLGEAWGDPTVAAAARLAEVLLQKADQSHNWWQLLNLAAIVAPRNVTLPDSTDDLQFELRTRGGSRILWGREPETSNPAELDVTGKLQRLRELHSRYGSPDSLRDQWLIDIRPLQGVDRSILSAQRSSESARN
ncbi:MAG: cell division protein FtsQ/DivIB, partial [Planctomyces sp.]